MSQPVKLSDALVLDARISGEVQERSIAGQIEFWAKLGRSLDLLLKGKQVIALRRNGGAQPLSEALADVDTPAGRKRVAEVLASQPFPHYKQFSGEHGLLIRIDEDGTETVGRFVNRAFVPSEHHRDLKADSITSSKAIDGGKWLGNVHISSDAARKGKAMPSAINAARKSRPGTDAPRIELHMQKKAKSISQHAISAQRSSSNERKS